MLNSRPAHPASGPGWLMMRVNVPAGPAPGRAGREPRVGGGCEICSWCAATCAWYIPTRRPFRLRGRDHAAGQAWLWPTPVPCWCSACWPPRFSIPPSRAVPSARATCCSSMAITAPTRASTGSACTWVWPARCCSSCSPWQVSSGRRPPADASPFPWWSRAASTWASSPRTALTAWPAASSATTRSTAGYGLARRRRSARSRRVSPGPGYGPGGRRVVRGEHRWHRPASDHRLRPGQLPPGRQRELVPGRHQDLVREPGPPPAPNPSRRQRRGRGQPPPGQPRRASMSPGGRWIIFSLALSQSTGASHLYRARPDGT